MKKNKKSADNIFVKNSPLTPLPLVPIWLLVPLWLISLVVSNLIYSGVRFADTLHILKWTVTGVPVAVAVLVAGARIFIYGRERIKVKFDVFAIIWGIILIYCALQPLWVKISSPTGYVLEMVCFITVWAYYVITVSSFPDFALRIVLILASLNAAINTFFAELQIRGMNNFAFLKGTIFEFMTKYSSIILPTPGHYIGNTAQQNMFGLWLAITTFGAIYLFVFDTFKNDSDEHGKKIFIPAIIIALSVLCIKFSVTEENILLGVLAGILILSSFLSVYILKGKKHLYLAVFAMLLAGVNIWGLLNSTSRSAMFAFLGSIILMFIFSAWKFNRNYVIRIFAVGIILCTVFYVSLSSPRTSGTLNKINDIVEHYETIGSRRGIWLTSYTMAAEHPEGVGIGQYKWHYMEAQREAFNTSKWGKSDWYKWQYTHWAHNEFLQFFCEGGIIGGIMFVIMYSFWFFGGVVGVFRKRNVNMTSVWGFCIVSLISFSAFFTRPFHRIENMVWIALGFALSNREFFPEFKFTTDFEILKQNYSRKIAGILCVISSIAGVIYISSGIYGNYLLRQALSTQNASLQYYLLTEADKHPIVREEVQRNLGYHYMSLGEQQNDTDLLLKGFETLWSHFNREPHSEDISKLLNFSQRYQIENVMREIVSYFKPGTYHFERRIQKDSEGKNVNALLLMNGPGRDDK